MSSPKSFLLIVVLWVCSAINLVEYGMCTDSGNICPYPCIQPPPMPPSGYPLYGTPPPPPPPSPQPPQVKCPPVPAECCHQAPPQPPPSPYNPFGGGGYETPPPPYPYTTVPEGAAASTSIHSYVVFISTVVVLFLSYAVGVLF